MKKCKCGHNFGKHHLVKYRIEPITESGIQLKTIYQTQTRMAKQKHSRCAKCNCKEAVKDIEDND